MGTFLHFLDGLLGFIANVPFGILKTASWNRRSKGLVFWAPIGVWAHPTKSKEMKDKRESQFLVDIRDLNHKV